MSDDDAEVEYEVESFAIQSHTFHITTVSFMPIERLLDLQSQAQEISGQKLWCGSLCVMEYLLGSPEFVAGKYCVTTSHPNTATNPYRGTLFRFCCSRAWSRNRSCRDALCKARSQACGANR